MLMTRDVIYGFLQGCMKMKDLAAGRQVHSCMVSTGLDSIGILGDCLIHLNASGGSLLEASLAFCRVAKPSIYTWHAIILAHTRFGESERAIELYCKMQKDGLTPSKFIYLCILKACCSIEALGQGRLVHCQIIRTGLDSDMIIGTTLVDMYTKFGSLQEAHNVFDKSPNRDGVLWGALIAGYSQHGQGLSALELFEKMQEEGIMPDRFTYSCVLKVCGSIVAIELGKKIHNNIVKSGLDSDVVIGSTLVGMYAKYAKLEDARKVFDTWPNRDIVLWGAMIAGYSQHGHGFPALEIFRKMQEEGIRPDKVIYSCALKACSTIDTIGQGRLIHEEIVISRLELDVIVGNTLVDMYAKCGTLEEAWKVFDGLPKHNVVSWNAMIAAYDKHGLGLLGIKLFGKMRQEGIQPDNISFSCTLKAGGSVGALGEGRLIHDQIIRMGIEADTMVTNTLIDMYTKCGSLREAHTVFDNFSNKDLVSWNAIISGNAHCERTCLALELFAEMQDTGIEPDRVTFSCVLKACGNAEDINQGRLIHAQIIRSGLELDLMIGNTLIDMYSKCRSVEAAQKVFDELPSRNVVSWNAMMSGYSQQGHGFHALELFDKMQKQGLEPDTVTFSCILKACGIIGAIGQGWLIHELIIAGGLELDGFIRNTLVDMYVKCESLVEAQHVFETLPSRDVVSWNALIAGYTQPENDLIALELFNRMQQEGMQPDTVTFACILTVCSSTGAIGQGRLIHNKIIRRELQSNGVISSTLIDMYSNCGILEEAQKVFLEFPCQDVVSWNAIIAGYTQHGHVLSALSFFAKMQEEGIQPDKVTFSSILKGCGSAEALKQGRVIHEQMMRSGIETDVVVGSTLVDMYAKCGSLEEARRVFDEWPNRDVVLWSAMIAGYVQHSRGLSALELFSNMKQEGLQPDQVTFACILKACGSVGAVGQGQLIHDCIIRSGLELDIAVGTSLIDMYAKAGSLEDACKVFGELSNRSVEAWGAMIAGYSQHGYYWLAGKCLEDMQQQGLKPDGKIYTNVLTACSHAAVVGEGHRHFHSMTNEQGIIPGIEQFNCMINLLGRAGCLNEADEMLQTMPIPPDLVGWMSLLTACKTFGNIKLGRQCFDQVLQLNSNIGAGYVLMSNIFNDAHRREDTHEIQELKRCVSAWKKPGRAWIEVKDKVHEFVVGDDTHPQSENFSAKLQRLKIPMKCRGYVPHLDCVSTHMSDEQEEFAIFELTRTVSKC